MMREKRWEVGSLVLDPALMIFCVSLGKCLTFLSLSFLRFPKQVLFSRFKSCLTLL